MIKSVKKKEEKFHNKWAESINLKNITIFQAFQGPVSPEYHLAIKLLGQIEGKKILNPGCGAGEETIFLASRGASVCAADISEGMLNIVKKLSEKFKFQNQISLHKVDVEKKLDFPDQSFDFIFGNSILHHVSINKAILQLSRVLKKGGKAVFIEPLAYNPIINYYRKIANKVRTPDEHPLKKADIDVIKKRFKYVNHYEFHFLTLLIFCYFFIIERVHPNKDRYWKKIIREGEKYKKAFRILHSIDKIILKIFPPLRWLCWAIVIEAIKT